MTSAGVVVAWCHAYGAHVRRTYTHAVALPLPPARPQPHVPPQVRFNPNMKFGPRPDQRPSFRLTVATRSLAVRRAGGRLGACTHG